MGNGICSSSTDVAKVFTAKKKKKRKKGNSTVYNSFVLPPRSHDSILPSFLQSLEYLMMPHCSIQQSSEPRSLRRCTCCSRACTADDGGVPLYLGLSQVRLQALWVHLCCTSCVVERATQPPGTDGDCRPGRCFSRRTAAGACSPGRCSWRGSRSTPATREHEG